MTISKTVISLLMYLSGTAVLVIVVALGVGSVLGIFSPKFLYDYYIPISALVIALFSSALILEFEAKAGLRDISNMVILIALISAARVPFAPLPSIQPCTVMIMTVGYVYGARRGAMVGAFVPVVSNLVLGHGPWTLWQMGAWALAGSVGGGLGMVTRDMGRGELISFAVVAAAMGFIYGWVLDIFSALFYGSYIVALISSFPFDLLHASGNAIFAPIIFPLMKEQLCIIKRRHSIEFID